MAKTFVTQWMSRLRGMGNIVYHSLSATDVGRWAIPWIQQVKGRSGPAAIENSPQVKEGAAVEACARVKIESMSMSNPDANPNPIAKSPGGGGGEGGGAAAAGAGGGVVPLESSQEPSELIRRELLYRKLCSKSQE
ncbi:hypothetical protein KR009_003644 [Drosophila setifemur]|nr:hypothetical protein KR009_003644 [Drosophila setifemur]